MTAIEADLLLPSLAVTEFAIVTERDEKNMTTIDVRNCVRRAHQVATQDAMKQVAKDTICRIPLILVWSHWVVTPTTVKTLER